jgi:ArsR family transcriptional regulator
MSKPSEAFKALGDPVRLRLFYLLCCRDELCVCHLTDALKLPQSTVSRHLGVLRHAGLVATRRDGKWMYYRLSGEMAQALAGIVGKVPDAAMQTDALQLTNILQDC